MNQKIAVFLENRWFNAIVLVLAIVSLISLFIEIMLAKSYPIFDSLEIWILVFFTVEFALNIYVAKKLVDYMIEGDGLVDLLSILSGLVFIQALQSIRILRALRAIRIFKLFQGISGRTLNGIIMVQMVIALGFSALILDGCKLKVDHYLPWNRLEQLLFLFVLAMIFSTAFIVKVFTQQCHSCRSKASKITALSA